MVTSNQTPSAMKMGLITVAELSKVPAYWPCPYEIGVD